MEKKGYKSKDDTKFQMEKGYKSKIKERKIEIRIKSPNRKVE